MNSYSALDWVEAVGHQVAAFMQKGIDGSKAVRHHGGKIQVRLWVERRGSGSDGGGHSSLSDNRRVGWGAASAMSSTGLAAKLALNARGGVWAWCPHRHADT